MTNSMMPILPFDWNRLNRSHFFEECFRCAEEHHLFSKEQIENIQLQILHLLFEQVKKFTAGESSSVPQETAERLAEGILYTIGVYLADLQSTEKIMMALKNQPLSEQFFEGQKKIKILVDLTAEKLKKLQKTAPDYDNIAYQDTVTKGLDSFFYGYNIFYFPQEGNSAIDYPLNIDKMDEAGILYMDSYIHKLEYENTFCQLFNQTTIRSLMQDFIENSSHYLFNIFHLVLLNAIASVLLNRSPQCLELIERDGERLQIQLAGEDREQIYGKVIRAADQIAAQLDMDERMRQYYGESVAAAAEEISSAVCRGSLNHLFVFMKDEKIPLLSFQDQSPMEDCLFRKLTDEIRGCTETNEKLSIIRKEVSSFEDFADILESGCLFGEEYEAVFSTLGQWELALLTARILQRAGELEDTEDGWEWQISFRNHLDSLDVDDRRKVVSIARQLNSQNDL